MRHRYRATDRSPGTDHDTPISRRPTLRRSHRALLRQDLEEVGKDIGRSKTAGLIFLDERLGHLRLPRSRALHQLWKSARTGGSRPSNGWHRSWIYQNNPGSTPPRCTASLCQLNQSISPGLLSDVSVSSEKAMSVIAAPRKTNSIALSRH
jgi:hypothetical protein